MTDLLTAFEDWLTGADSWLRGHSIHLQLLPPERSPSAEHRVADFTYGDDEIAGRITAWLSGKVEVECVAPGTGALVYEEQYFALSSEALAVRLRTFFDRVPGINVGAWHPAPPAPPDALESLRAGVALPLPEAYLRQLASSNGGDGDLGVPPGRISFWPAEEVLRRNEGYGVGTFAPGFLAFASSGGGEMLAFDTRTGAPYAIVMVPFIPMDAAQAVVIADSFEELIPSIGHYYRDRGVRTQRNDDRDG